MSLEDRFDIGSPIHIGQITAAYPAIQKGLNRKVLLKVIHPQWAKDPELVARFDREGKAMAQINHSNVVKVYEYGRSDDVPFMALEWIDGGTLADKLKEGPLNQDEIKRIAKDVLDGLKAVHDKGFVHRDLKPDNILTGCDGHTRLADFSLAGFDERSALTEHGAVVGSPAYMAPELLDGRPATPRSDLFGLGVILFEALTGSNPFQATDPMVSLDLVRRITPPSLISRKNIDPKLAALVDSLLARDPNERPGNTSDALSILKDEASAGLTLEKEETTRFNLSYLWRWGVLIVIITLSLWFLLRQNNLSPESADELIDTSVSSQPITNSIINETTITDPFHADINKSQPETTSFALDIKQKINDIITTPITESKTTLEIAELMVIVRPWARVFMDGSDLGVTPLGTLEIQAGEHLFLFRNELYPSIERVINIKSYEKNILSVDLQAESGCVEISAQPWGYLWVNEDSIGLLPRSDPLWLTPGRHQFSITHPTFGEWSDSVSVEKNQHYNVYIDLKSGTMIANLIE